MSKLNHAKTGLQLRTEWEAEHPCHKNPKQRQRTRKELEQRALEYKRLGKIIPAKYE